MGDQLLRLAAQLAQHSTSAPGTSSSTSNGHAFNWASIASTARELANALRSRGDIDYHDIVGSTALPGTLTLLLEATRDVETTSGRIPSINSAPAAYELLRIGANLCVDHDANRGRLLSAKYPQTVLDVLESYQAYLSELFNADLASLPSLALDHLKIIKTAFGVILNASMEYRPIRLLLVSRKAPATILRLSSLIYPVGAWRKVSPNAGPTDVLKEEWVWRSGVSAWSWRVLEVFRESETDIAWDPFALTQFVRSLSAFSPPFPTPAPAFTTEDAALRKSLINADVDALQEITVQIESLSVDSETFRTLLTSPSSPALPITNGEPDRPLTRLLQYVESGMPPLYWSSEQESDRKAWEKTFGLCKAAIIKSIVSVAGEDEQIERLWGENENVANGCFVTKMVGWIKDYPASVEARRDEERDDLVICATLSLGNLARKETRCLALIGAPILIVPHLNPLLEPSTDIKLKHGVVGLLKNLAQPQSSKTYLGESGTIDALARSGIWGRSGDIADIVQLSAIGIVKHLSTNHVPNALRLFAPADDGPSSIDQISDLIRRTDSLALRNEATRVLVNVIKTIWIPTSNNQRAASTTPPIQAEERKAALEKLTTEDTADALGEMIGRNIKYPVLLNEGIIALTLLASAPLGVPHVLTALVSPLGPEQPSTARSPASEGSTSTSQGGANIISTALEMILHILSTKGKVFPSELRSNACSLLSSVGRRDADVVLDAEKVAFATTVREAARPILETLASEPLQALEVPSPTSPLSPHGHPFSPIATSPIAATVRGPQLVKNSAIRALSVWGP